jgi:ribosome recycling factor
MANAQFDLKELERRMRGAIDTLKKEFGGLRTGRASIHLLDPVVVNVYGARMPIHQVATVSTPDARTISVQVWDRGQVSAVEKAIREANLGLNPMTDKDLVRVPVPPLTEERRREIVKQVKHKGEEQKLAIRNERRDAKELIAEAEKDGEVSADDAKKAQDKVQKATDDGVKKIDEMVQAKEKEVMQI